MWPLKSNGMKNAKHAISYSRLSHDVELQAEDITSPSGVLLPKERTEDHEIKQHRSSFYQTPLFKWTAIAALTVCNVGMFIGTIRSYILADYMCMQRSTVWSPVWEDVNAAYIPERFNGILDAPSKFRGPPSTAVDEAWSSLDDVGSISLDEKTFLRAGGTTENARMPDELGGGYMADVEVLHQMHCLNFVRMAAYSDHYRDIAPEWQDSNRTFHIHLEMIRINLLCQADGGIIPFRWVEDYQRPLPDFSTPHKCRDWNSVMDWAKERQVIMPPHYDWSHQTWEKVFPRPAWMPLPGANN
ncbi:tat pathway signal sequence [Sclerotinia borealis F-4128]|uniref:Tat pathway signal sequence n=1 Tax=Sclerotinia borealis (strain F-4128) TaxID=1432307 RepID=W9CKJ3_SCLBF|nr:tat pathway signal sequence [Sclerotinia borealis F-4128]